MNEYVCSNNRYSLDDLCKYCFLSDTIKEKLKRLKPGEHVDCGKHSKYMYYTLYHYTQEELDREDAVNVLKDEIKEIDEKIKERSKDLVELKKEKESKLRKLMKEKW